MSRLIAALLLAAACGGSSEPHPPRILVSIQAPAGSVELRVEVAADRESRARGLMERGSLPRGTGMLFLYPAPGRWGGIWMKNTLVPLDVAFVRDGVVVHLVSLEPCRADRCPSAAPDEPYDAVIEAGLRELAGAGVAPGSTVSVRGPLPSIS